MADLYEIYVNMGISGEDYVNSNGYNQKDRYYMISYVIVKFVGSEIRKMVPSA